MVSQDAVTGHPGTSAAGNGNATARLVIRAHPRSRGLRGTFITGSLSSEEWGKFKPIAVVHSCISGNRIRHPSKVGGKFATASWIASVSY